MSLLGLEPGDRHQHGSVGRESEAGAEVAGGPPVRVEPPQIDRVVDNDDLAGRAPLPRDEVSRIRLRDGDADVDAGGDDPVADRPQSRPPSGRRIVQVRGLHDDGHPACPADRRGEQAPERQVRVQDVDAAPRDHEGETEGGPDVRRPPQAQRDQLDVGGEVGLERPAQLGRAGQGHREPGAIQTLGEKEEMLLGASPGQAVREVQDAQRTRGVNGPRHLAARAAHASRSRARRAGEPAGRSRCRDDRRARRTTSRSRMGRREGAARPAAPPRRAP